VLVSFEAQQSVGMVLGGEISSDNKFGGLLYLQALGIYTR